MKRFLFLLATCLLSSYGWSQTKKVVIRIDTLDFIDGWVYREFRLFVTNQDFANLGEYFDSADYNYQRFPQYYNTIYVRSDSSQLRIPLDRDGGYVEIRDLYHSDLDTLQIDLYRQYSHCGPDTVRVWKTYFDVKTFEVDTTKSYFETKVEPLDCARKPPDTLVFRINDHRYAVPIHVGSEQRKKYTKGDGARRTLFGKYKDPFHVTTTNTYWINTAQINLNE